MIVLFDMSKMKVIMIPFPDEIVSTPVGNPNIIYSMEYCPYHLLFNESLALASHRRDEDDNGNLINNGNCSYEIWYSLDMVIRLHGEEDDTKVRCRGMRKGKLFLYDTLTRQALDLHISGIFTMVMTCPKTLFPIVSQ
ncbi:hypothetical protein FEM48_Zijuj05G0163500 [Ziziphus jujuba var. spinosa]|uniref:Uncharacterized protein n=1 Tax=Ziziphus jujuba var. spinosa TaxID=714518 RepID=A0A978VFV0_ZIZJJ|nr:hypothetical protein FEM48_Zijuj05G0163500 [Ziziphus jujuba var. spinosa]